MDNLKYRNITESALIKTGSGIIDKVIINSHSSGTLKLIDGLYNGVAASGTLTSSGAMVPASHATTKVTASTVVDGDTLTIGSTVYTAKDTLTGDAYEVAIGAGDADFLDNLKLAVNGTGTPGTNYGINTEKHPDVVATTNTDSAQTFVARLPGTAANSLATTTTGGTLTFEDTTFGGGTGDSDPGVTTAGATFTIGTRTYTAVLQLSEASGADPVADQILWVTSEAVFLDNIKSAINGTGLPGTDYSSTTSPNGDVVATTNTNTAQTFVARQLGTVGNSIATTETMANYAFGAATLGSGTGTTGRVLANTITFSAVATTGERVIDFGGISFDNGLLAVIGGTSADLTIAYR